MNEVGERCPVLELRRVSKRFKSGESWIRALEDVTLILQPGETLALVGPSGSGKSTLLALAAGLDFPDDGTVFVEGRDLASLSEDDTAGMRNRHIGFVYQNFQLLPTLTALENVTLPLELMRKEPFRHIRDKASEMLGRVGLLERLDHYPIQLSGGEQQRVALARAFVTEPALILADEPTGSLDRANAEAALEILSQLHSVGGTSILMVTHDRAAAERMQRRISLRDGILSDETL